MFFFYIAMYSIYGKREEVDPLVSSIHFSILFPVLGVFDAGIFRCEDALWDGSLPLFLPCSSAQRWPCDRSFPAVGSWPDFNVHMSHGHADVYAYIYMCMYIYKVHMIIYIYIQCTCIDTMCAWIVCIYIICMYIYIYIISYTWHSACDEIPSGTAQGFSGTQFEPWKLTWNP